MSADSPLYEPMLRKFAVGLLQQQTAQQQNQPATILHTYIREGWEALCALCFSQGVMPPQSLPELVQWLNTPIERWPQIGEMAQKANFSGPLMQAGGYPSELANLLGEPFANTYNPNLEMEDAVFREIFNICGRDYNTQLYKQVREFLNRNPIVTDWHEQITGNLEWNDQIRTLLSRCYEAIPAACIRWLDGKSVIYRCPHCGWPLVWKNNEALCHTDGPCKFIHNLSEESEPILYEDGAMGRTTEGIQRYVVAPEVALLQLYDALNDKWGVRCELYPELDAYDLLITLPNGQRWAVDVKDWHSAVSVALKVGLFSYTPEWDKAFYVFPNHRVRESGYLTAFQNYWTRQKDVTAMSYTQFIHHINQEIGK